ncbi:MAG: response regulator [Micrococcales bacterium]|nr:response regulator [Micrococcales bacterium]
MGRKDSAGLGGDEGSNLTAGPSVDALATLGRQAAGMAHELNNVLTSILGWAQVALREPRSAATTESALRTIEANARRARRILRDAMDAARAEGVRRPARIADIVDDALRLLDGELRRASIRVARVYERVPDLNVDRSSIEQVLVNLLLNAVQAMPQGGEIRVRVRPEGLGVALDVVDTGSGMTADVAQRAFEPFFSTKTTDESESSGGLGLGLAIARRLAEAHAGRLGFASTPGLGSTFTLWLPIGTPTDEEPEAVPAEAPASVPRRILVIDDEADIRELLATALALRGHIVETAADAASGVSRATQPYVSLVLRDYSLPGARGSEVLAELRARRPELPVLFMSGRSGVASHEHVSHGSGGTGWLRKPFDLDDVYREVARLLR